MYLDESSGHSTRRCISNWIDSMNETYSGPRTYDPVEFDCARYSQQALSFWLPHFLRLMDLRRNVRVLDIGCATGGFSIAVAAATRARLVGLELAENLLGYARAKPEEKVVQWVRGDAVRLPFRDARFDRAMMSLVLHQIPDREAAVREACRVLVPGGFLLIRSATPESVNDWLMCRYFPTVKEIESRRMPALPYMRQILFEAGLQDVHTETVNRNRRFDLDELISFLKGQFALRYPSLAEDEIEAGISKLKAELEGQTEIVDPRPHVFLTAKKR